MKLLLVSLSILILTGCTYATSVISDTDTDDELCQKLGESVLYNHTERIEIIKKVIYDRNVDMEACSSIAKQSVKTLTPKYKLDLCQKIALYQYKGAYEHYKKTLYKIQTLDFDDEECVTIAEFYLNRISRKQENKRAIRDALIRDALGQ